MSVKASFWAIEQRPRSRDHKLVLMLLADWADEDGEAWPRITTIAERAMCSVRHAVNVLNELEADDYLRKVRTRRRDGRQGSNRYRLHFDGPQ
jgi:MarR-like DNA-binding transcriptional regulator SgrR of sgrS sRNA